jgi:hypothetical protein
MIHYSIDNLLRHIEDNIISQCNNGICADNQRIDLILLLFPLIALRELIKEMYDILKKYNIEYRFSDRHVFLRKNENEIIAFRAIFKDIYSIKDKSGNNFIKALEKIFMHKELEFEFYRMESWDACILPIFNKYKLELNKSGRTSCLSKKETIKLLNETLEICYM